MNPDNKRCLIFTRVSTDKQDSQRQIQQLQKTANKYGYTLFKIVSEYISGATRNKKRPELQKVISYAERNEFDILMVTELSRLGRSPIDVLSAVEKLHDNGINIYIDQFSMFTKKVNGEINLMSELFISILSSFAHLERETIRERIKSGQDYARNIKGVKIGRPKGTKLTERQYLTKHADVVEYTKKGLSISDTTKLTGKSHQTISTVRKIIMFN
jgi:DNA invertase Pin-like site-specific DNA recombinase